MKKYDHYKFYINYYGSYKIPKKFEYLNKYFYNNYCALIMCFALPFIIVFYFSQKRLPESSEISNIGLLLIALNALKMAQNQLNWPKLQDSIFLANKMNARYFDTRENTLFLSLLIDSEFKELTYNQKKRISEIDFQLLSSELNAISEDSNRIKNNLNHTDNELYKYISDLFKSLHLAANELSKDTNRPEARMLTYFIKSMKSNAEINISKYVTNRFLLDNQGSLLEECDVVEILEEYIRKLK